MPRKTVPATELVGPKATPKRTRMWSAALLSILAGASLSLAAPAVATPQGEAAAVERPSTMVDSTRWMQKDLAGLGYLPMSGVDGVFGPQTEAALEAFQNDNGLRTDGVYGPRSARALDDQVERVQAKVGTTVDGAYGSATLAAVEDWQRAHGLLVDGIAGPNTMAEMGLARTVREIAQHKFGKHGWSVGGQFSCLDQLWIHESNWLVYAENPSSGAYGIPQALPPEKMADAGSDWRTNPYTQIEWGLDYIDSRYGTPCGAWDFWQDNNWYTAGAPSAAADSDNPSVG